MKTYPRATGLARVIVLLLLVLSVGAAMASGSNKWRIKFNHSARSDGTIVLNISSKDEAPMTVTTQVPKGTSEDHVAKLVRDSLRAQLGEHYHIEIDDGEDVLVKKHFGQPDLDISLGSNTVQGVTVKFHKE